MADKSGTASVDDDQPKTWKERFFGKVRGCVYFQHCASFCFSKITDLSHGGQRRATLSLLPIFPFPCCDTEIQESTLGHRRKQNVLQQRGEFVFGAPQAAPRVEVPVFVLWNLVAYPVFSLEHTCCLFVVVDAAGLLGCSWRGGRDDEEKAGVVSASTKSGFCSIHGQQR